jgi:hypothetical protein
MTEATRQFGGVLTGRRATSPRQQVIDGLTPVLLMPIRETTVVAQHWINGRGCLWVPASPPRRWPAAVDGTLKPSLNFCLAWGVQGAPDFVVPTQASSDDRRPSMRSRLAAPTEPPRARPRRRSGQSRSFPAGGQRPPGENGGANQIGGWSSAASRSSASAMTSRKIVSARGSFVNRSATRSRMTRARSQLASSSGDALLGLRAIMPASEPALGQSVSHATRRCPVVCGPRAR